jgi:hypothetical protein
MIVAILVCSLLSVARILALYIGEKIFYLLQVTEQQLIPTLTHLHDSCANL